MNEARTLRVVSAYQRIEARRDEFEQDIREGCETHIKMLERHRKTLRLCYTDWDRLLDAAAARAELADQYARQEYGITERSSGAYEVSHSWDVYFASCEPDGSQYMEQETSGYQAWYFSTQQGAEAYARLLNARFGADANYGVSVHEIY